MTPEERAKEYAAAIRAGDDPLAVLRNAWRAAENAAYERAAHGIEVCFDGSPQQLFRLASRIRALKSQPAREGA